MTILPMTVRNARQGQPMKTVAKTTACDPKHLHVEQDYEIEETQDAMHQRQINKNNKLFEDTSSRKDAKFQGINKKMFFLKPTDG